jgi:homoaconitase/3-isopropylmalate dehydratase large subunit
LGYLENVKTVWQGRALQVAAKYGEQAPMATVCCNACRTCTTTNLLALATGMGLGALYAVGRFGKRIVRR